MDGQGKLEPIAFAVSMITIICLAVSLGALFCLYAFYKSRHVKHGHEDPKIAKDLEKQDEEAVSAYASLLPARGVIDKAIVYRDDYIVTYRMGGIKLAESDRHHFFREAEEARRQKKRWKDILSAVVSGVLFLIFAGAVALATTYRLQGQSVSLGGVAYYTILTGSMEEKNSYNTYLYDENLNDQIEQYSLIGIEEVKQDDIALYDILAYEHDGETIVHRLVSISIDREGGPYYTLRGDANASSLEYEIALTYDAIIGRYNGFQSYGLGVAILYLQSNIGLVALSAASLFILASSISEDAIDAAYDKRRRIVADKLDGCYSNDLLKK